MFMKTQEKEMILLGKRNNDLNDASLSKSACPMIHSELKNCYSTKEMSSANMRKALEYCLGSYTRCDIYRKVSEMYNKLKKQDEDK